MVTLSGRASQSQLAQIDAWPGRSAPQIQKPWLLRPFRAFAYRRSSGNGILEYQARYT
jgi:hypothetical protein